jgi:hypothetical protein
VLHFNALLQIYITSNNSNYRSQFLNEIILINFQYIQTLHINVT